MKTTVEIPDELLIEAKKEAAERRTTLRELITRGLRRELGEPEPVEGKSRARKIRWVVAPGGLPPGLDVSDRERMQDWMRDERWLL